MTFSFIKNADFCVLIKQWPLAPNSREWRITRANVARRVTFFSKTAVGECWRVWRVLAKRLGECCEFGESMQHGLANVGESGESVHHGLANVGEFGEYSPSLLANVGASAHDKIGRFKHK